MSERFSGSLGKDPCFLHLIMSIARQDVELNWRIIIFASLFWQNIPSCQNWCVDPFGNGVYSTLNKTYLHKLPAKTNSLEEKLQTGHSAQINVCMRFRAKDLEPQNQSTSLIGLDTEPVFTCFVMHTEPFNYSCPMVFIMGYYPKCMPDYSAAPFYWIYELQIQLMTPSVLFLC